MKASIYDVAKKAGVSVVTVSRVINNVPTVRASSKEKVMKAIKLLNYQPNVAAQILARGRSNVIGLLIPNLTDPFIMEVVHAVDYELKKNGYFLALSVTSNANEESEFLFQQERVDGVLILTPLSEKSYVSSLKSKNIPFVIMDNQVFPYTESSIVVDNLKGGYDVTRFLLEKGHVKISCIGGPENLISSEHRVKGFCNALQEVGLKPFSVVRGKFDVDTGYKVAMDWIENNMLPTGIICGDDHIAFGVLDALKEKGIKVPEEVSVIGYDDHPFASKLHPYLTTVKQPAIEMGEKGVKTLLEKIQGVKKNNIVIKLEAKLIERSSTGTIENNLV